MRYLILNLNYRHLGFFVNYIMLLHCYAYAKLHKLQLLIPDDYRFGTIKVPIRDIFPDLNYISSDKLLTKFNTGQPKTANRELLRQKYPDALFSFDVVNSFTDDPIDMSYLYDCHCELWHLHPQLLSDINTRLNLVANHKLGLHYRCGDKIMETKCETPSDNYNRKIADIMKSSDDTIFAATDDITRLSELESYDHIITLSKGDGYSVAKQTRSSNPRQDLEDLLTEVICLTTKCDHFLGYWASNLSRFVAFARNFKNVHYVDHPSDIPSRIINTL